MDTMFTDSLSRLLAAHCTPAVVREAERTQRADALWAEIEASGFLDALIDEAAGGGGLGLRGGFELLLLCGRHAVPLPLAQTLWLRAVLAHAGMAPPGGRLTLAAPGRVAADGSIERQGVPFGRVADWVLVPLTPHAVLLPLVAAEVRATGVRDSLQAHLRWAARPEDAIDVPGTTAWLEAGALLTSALMAGAMGRVLEATLGYANDRAQFGKPIGRFQAVQQQLAVMAEQVFAARMAAELGCAGAGIGVHPLRAAVAKARAGEAADKVVAIAHAVHGAIGVTADFDLQLHTRRLQEWRGDYGSQAYWQPRIGAALLAAPQRATLPFLLQQRSSAPP
jgi:acyl-CoA dehydrogenase